MITSTHKWIKWMQDKINNSEKLELDNFTAASINPIKNISTPPPIDPFAPKIKSKVHPSNTVYISTAPNPALHKASHSTN